MPLSPGTRLGSYEILSPLGAGGMGEIYRARHVKLGREAAVKVLPSDVSWDPERLHRFEREARAASALNHPSIVTIYDIDEHEGRTFIAMELVDGVTLRNLLSEGPLDTRETLRLASAIAEGLARAHAAGIVHRDLKPDNVMITADGRYYADPAFVQVPEAGLLSKVYAKERAALIDPKRASTSFLAGDPLPHDPHVKQWDFWKANLIDATSTSQDDSAGIVKDTTHMAVIDEEGNVFDATPSGGWVPGAVILGDTGIGMSVRGEQFWLDETRANQIRPRARPRYTLTPSIVFKGDTPCWPSARQAATTRTRRFSRRS